MSTETIYLHNSPSLLYSYIPSKMAPFRKAALWLFRESGIKTVLTTSYDARILLTSRFIRMFAYGSSTLILALYFQALGHSDAKLGLFITLTLLGDVLVSLLLTAVADSIGRRQILLLGALLMTASGVVFATSSNYWVLLVAAVVGVISPRCVSLCFSATFRTICRALCMRTVWGSHLAVEMR
jgi:MFS family permease